MALTKSYNIKNNVKHLTNLFNYDFNANKIPGHFIHFENCEQDTFLSNMLLLEAAKNHAAGKDIKNQFFSGELLFKIPMATATQEDKERVLQIGINSLKRHLGPDIAFCCVLHEKSDDDSDDGYLHIHYLGSRVNIAEPKKAILPCTQEYDWDDISKIAKEEEFKVFGDKYASHPLTYKEFNKFKKEHGLETGKTVGEQQYFVDQGILKTEPGSGTVLVDNEKLNKYKSNKKSYYSKTTSLGSSVVQSKTRPWEYTISDKPNATKNALNHIYTDIDNAIADVRHQHELDPSKGLGLGYVLKELRSIGYKVGNERKDSKNPLTLQYRNHAWKMKAPGYTREDIDARCKGLMDFEPNHPTVATFINTDNELFKETDSKTKKQGRHRNQSFGQMILRTFVSSLAKSNAVGLLLAILLLIILFGLKKIKEETAIINSNNNLLKVLNTPKNIDTLIEQLDKGVALNKVEFDEEQPKIKKDDAFYENILNKFSQKKQESTPNISQTVPTLTNSVSKQASESSLESENKTTPQLNATEGHGFKPDTIIENEVEPGSGNTDTPTAEMPGPGDSAMEEPGSGTDQIFDEERWNTLIDHIKILNYETNIAKEVLIDNEEDNLKIKFPNLNEEELRKKSTNLAKKTEPWKRANETINFSKDYIKKNFPNFFNQIEKTDNLNFDTPTKFTASPTGIIDFFYQKFYDCENPDEIPTTKEVENYLKKNFPQMLTDFKSKKSINFNVDEVNQKILDIKNLEKPKEKAKEEGRE